MCLISSGTQVINPPTQISFFRYVSHLSHVGIAFLGNKKATKMLRFISKFYNYYL